MKGEKRDVRLVVYVSQSERERLNDYRHGNRIGSEGEALRQLLFAGLDVLAPSEMSQIVQADLPAPPIPAPADCGRPVLGELILPWMREQGKRTYSMGEVLQGVFKESEQQHAMGRDKVVQNLFKAIGWKAQTVRAGGVTTRLFHFPE